MKLRTLLIAGAVIALLVGMTTVTMSQGNQNQNGATQSRVPALTLTDAEELNIVYMRQEEKVARDVYLTLDELWAADIFANISESEQQHMDAIENLITRYGLTDPVVDDTVGVFANSDFQTMYDELVAAGSVSLEEALKVGVLIEEQDIADLEKALEETTQRSIQRVFENLLEGSTNHLDAFNACLDGDCPCLPDA
ncbi:MAG: DUF2202 domain-containing protein [Sedimentisphaerales bacterium]|nr:DUF2202 domain-containing protein [Sedimentisphaerales bacterium]